MGVRRLREPTSGERKIVCTFVPTYAGLPHSVDMQYCSFRARSSRVSRIEDRHTRWSGGRAAGAAKSANDESKSRKVLWWYYTSSGYVAVRSCDVKCWEEGLATLRDAPRLERAHSPLRTPLQLGHHFTLAQTFTPTEQKANTSPNPPKILASEPTASSCVGRPFARSLVQQAGQPSTGSSCESMRTLKSRRRE